MSAPVMSVALSAQPPVAAFSGQGHTDAAAPAEGEFSRVLADQNRPAEHPPSSPAIKTPMSNKKLLPAHSREDQHPMARDAAEASIADTAEPGNRPDAAHVKRRIGDSGDMPPDASLAALTLDIAKQTIDQLRGAQSRLHAAQTGTNATTDTLVASVRPDSLTPDQIDPRHTPSTVLPPASGELRWLPTPDAQRPFLLPSSLAMHAGAPSASRPGKHRSRHSTR